MTDRETDELELYEIENHRYLKEAFFVLPLSTGRIAILTPRRDLFKLVDTWEEAKIEGPKAEAYNRQSYEIVCPPQIKGLNIKLEL